MSKSSELTITPVRALVDTPLNIRLSGFVAGQKVIVQAQTTDSKNVVWKSKAIYDPDAQGEIDLNKQVPISSVYENADAMGLIWSMTPQETTNPYVRFTPPVDLSSYTITFDVLIDDKVVASKQVERLQVADDVQRIEVRENGLVGTLFLPPGNGPHSAITLVSGGSVGGLSEYEAAAYASHGYAGFALAFFNYETLPKYMVDIPLEYFEAAINYLQSRKDIDSERLAIGGPSRCGELALLLGSLFSQYKVVIATVPSGIVWGGFGYDPAEGNRPAWLYKGEAIPYMDNEFDPETYNTYYAEYVERDEAIPGTPALLAEMQRSAAFLKKAEIPVENINGAVLMISGEDDQMWPSTKLADISMKRLKEHGFNKPYDHLSYPGAGHLIVLPYSPTTVTSIKHPVDGGFYAFGGKPEATYRACVDSWHKKLDYLKKYL